MNNDARERPRLTVLSIEEWLNWLSYALGVDDDAPPCKGTGVIPGSAPSSTATITDEMVEAVNALPGWSGFTRDDLRQLVAALGSVLPSASSNRSDSDG